MFPKPREINLDLISLAAKLATRKEEMLSHTRLNGGMLSQGFSRFAGRSRERFLRGLQAVSDCLLSAARLNLFNLICNRRSSWVSISWAGFLASRRSFLSLRISSFIEVGRGPVWPESMRGHCRHEVVSPRVV